METIAPRAYMAGPLFDEGERWWIEQLDAFVTNLGYQTFLPHRDNPQKTSENTQQIFENNRAAIDAADTVIANLNGVTTDDGTAWEIGYASAKGIPIIGIHTDWRQRFTDETVNLMIEHSLGKLVRSLDELEAGLRAFLNYSAAARTAAAEENAQLQDKISARLHIVEGVLRALDNAEQVLPVITGQQDRDASKRVLMDAPWNFSDMQATHILDMSFARTTALGRNELREEADQLRREIDLRD